MELGSGTGLAGIALAHLQPAAMILSDLPEVVPLLRENLLLNSVIRSGNRSTDSGGNGNSIGESEAFVDETIAQVLRNRYIAVPHRFDAVI